MERLVFASIGKGNIRYIWVYDHYKMDNHGFYSNCGGYVSNCAFQYDTLGDGDTQHTPEYLVHKDDIEDYICSMAVYVAENPTKETFDVLSQGIHLNNISVDTVKFLVSLKSNGKPLYYNLHECKKSTASRLEHDKRWERLPDDYEGTFRTIYNMTVPNFYGFLDRLYLAEEIRGHANYDLWIDYEHDFGLSRSNSQVFTAMNIIQTFIEAMQKMESIKQAYECMRSNLRLDALPVDLPEEI